MSKIHGWSNLSGEQIPRATSRRIGRSISGACSFIALFILISSGMLGAAEPPRPNVIVILADDMGRGDYSAFGTKDIRTPAIDRLCREGMTFENFRANSCVCSPTRAALMTGCFPDRVGVPGVIRHTPTDSWGWLAPHAVLLPQILKPQGYHSAIIGKWHLGLASPNTPTERGFDFFHGFLGDMMDDYLTHRRGEQNFMRRNQDVIDPEGHATDLFTDWACDYLTEHAASRPDAAQASPPFFLYLAYNAPHDPIQPPAAWREKVRQREPGMPEQRVGLVALIEQMDAGIGKVLDTLDRLKLTDNTLVFFTSDNGGLLRYQANNGPWRSEKTHMYEGGLRVPAVARWPSQIASGSQTARPVVTMDLFATIAEVAGATTPHGIDAISFLPTLRGQSPAETASADSQRELYFVRREGGHTYGGKTIEALIQGEWKLIQNNPFQPLELYHLAADPKESRNRIQDEKAIAERLSAMLRKHIQNGGQVAWQQLAN